MSALILFDCDGTLTDSNALIVGAIRAAFVDAGLQAPDPRTILNTLGMSLHGVLAALLKKLVVDGADIEQLAQSYRQHYWAGENEIILYPHVLETLETLRLRGYWLAIVTGKSKSGLLRVFDRFPLLDYISAWRTADCCPSKPHPAMAYECMQELGVTAERTALVGDACFDMRMAKAAGVRALGVAFGADNEQILLDEGAESVVHQFEDLLDCFPSLA